MKNPEVDFYEVRWGVTFSQVIDDGDISAHEAADWAVELGADTTYTKNMRVQAYDRDGNKIGRPKYISRASL